MWPNLELLLITNQWGGKKYISQVAELCELISEKMEFAIHSNMLNNFTVKNYTKLGPWAAFCEVFNCFLQRA